MQEFANNKKVAFADVNLSEEQIREAADGTSDRTRLRSH